MTFNLNNVIGDMFGKDKQKIFEDGVTPPKKNKHRQIIQNKLKLCGFGQHKILGFIVGDLFYIVKLDDNTILKLEKNGRVVSIFQDRTK